MAGLSSLLMVMISMCVCLCLGSRVQRLESRVARIEGNAVFHNDLAYIDEKLETFNSSVAQCLDSERVQTVISDNTARDESLDVARVTLALADEKARWRREASAIKSDIADNRHDIGDMKKDFVITGNAIVKVKKSLESTVRQVSDDVVQKVSKVEMKTYVDNAIDAMKEEIMKALRESLTSCPQTTTLTTPDAPDQTTTLTTPDAPDQTTTLTTLDAPDQTTTPTKSPVQPTSCLELYHSGERQSGVYTIYPLPTNKPVQVYCDMDTDGGGWTVFQRRQDGSVNFYRTWADYASGFGTISGEFWLGNDLISSLTSRGPHELRIDLKDYDNNSVFAKYGTFKISPSAAKYKLEVGGFSGDAGDALDWHSGMAFTTQDRDNDGASWTNCAEDRQGAWWYNKCAYSNLNGLYGQGHSYRRGVRGVYWYFWKDSRDPLMWTEMKLRATPQA